jgi:hypothetical protein
MNSYPLFKGQQNILTSLNRSAIAAFSLLDTHTITTCRAVTLR